MSKYTTELRHLLDSETTGFTIGLNDYPIFDENYRPVLNKLIIEHFWFREIGMETPARFKYYLNRKMREIMPLYNKYYEAELIKIDPLKSYYVSEVYKKTNDSTSEGNGTSSGSVTTNDASVSTGSQNTDNLNVKQDTPQSGLTKSDLLGNIYASEAAHDENSITSENNSASAGVQSNTSTGSSDSSIHSIDEYAHAVAGNKNSKSQSNLIMEFRKSFINVNMLVVESLDDCFMQVW